MKIFITGIGGLIGSTVAEVAAAAGHSVAGIDCDNRGRWFGSAGSVKSRMEELRSLGISARDYNFRETPFWVEGHDLIVHCAGQPSHDYSRANVMEDSYTNYVGTVELLEATWKYAPKAVFVFMSTNKVYGDLINQAEYVIDDKRYALKRYAAAFWGREIHQFGIDEHFPIDNSLHTPFGVSKLGADLMVQEYRRTFGLKTVTFRCGCMTGPAGAPVELHGFLGYLVKCAVEGKKYTIYGHKGYQVRDNIAAKDVAQAVLLYAENPKQGVYNLGGGPANAVSINEVIEYLWDIKALRFPTNHYGDERLGDHKWWITDTRRFESDYPEWTRQNVWSVIDEMVESQRSRRDASTANTALSASLNEP